MKQKKYSESKIRSAQSFLSKYNLTFDCLDEPQKKAVISYTQSQKFALIFLVLLVLGIVSFSNLAYQTYQALNYFSGDKYEVSTLVKNEAALELFGKHCFELGFDVAQYSSFAFIMLTCIFLIFIRLRIKYQILNAFLPAIQRFDDK